MLHLRIAAHTDNVHSSKISVSESFMNIMWPPGPHIFLSVFTFDSGTCVLHAFGDCFAILNGKVVTIAKLKKGQRGTTPADVFTLYRL